MTASRDPDRLIHDFLLEGEEQLDDQVYDAVRGVIEQKRQRVVFGPWRFPEMNKFLAVGLGTAAVVAVLIVGAQLLGSPNAGTGGDPTATAEPSAAPTLDPTPSPTPAGLLPEGPLLWSDPALEKPPTDGAPPVTVTIPASGWTFLPETGETGAPLIKGDDVNNLPEAAMLVVPTQAGIYVYGDPCQYESTTPDTPVTTVDEVTTALAGQASRDASDPVDVTVGGFAGTSIILHVPDDAVFADCEGGEFAMFRVDGETGPGRYSQGPGQVDELWILDVEGAIVIIDAMYRPDTPTGLIEEMRSIAESATFEAP
jgi:hypothetical protein